MDSFKTVVSASLKKNTSDYHHNTNAPHFEELFQEKVLPSLPDKSVAVIDNAHHHSRMIEERKRPIISWRMAAIQEWLTGKGIQSEKKGYCKKVSSNFQDIQV